MAIAEGEDQGTEGREPTAAELAFLEQERQKQRDKEQEAALLSQKHYQKWQELEQAKQLRQQQLGESSGELAQEPVESLKDQLQTALANRGFAFKCLQDVLNKVTVARGEVPNAYSFFQTIHPTTGEFELLNDPEVSAKLGDSKLLVANLLNAVLTADQSVKEVSEDYTCARGE